jgi:hypothetical protein
MIRFRSIFVILPLLLGIVYLQSCEKDEVKIDKSELLTENIWAYDTLEIVPTTDAGFLLAAAVLHMAFQGAEYDFYKDGTYDMTSDMTSISGIWELVENKTLLLDKGTENEMSLEILKINDVSASFKLHLEGEYFNTPYAGDLTMKFRAK